jgi:hypothetical protein
VPVECRLSHARVAWRALRQAAGERRGEGEPELDHRSASGHYQSAGGSDAGTVRIYRPEVRRPSSVPLIAPLTGVQSLNERGNGRVLVLSLAGRDCFAAA